MVTTSLVKRFAGSSTQASLPSSSRTRFCARAFKSRQSQKQTKPRTKISRSLERMDISAIGSPKRKTKHHLIGKRIIRTFFSRWNPLFETNRLGHCIEWQRYYASMKSHLYAESLSK